MSRGASAIAQVLNLQFPTVEPRSTPPGDYLNIQPSPRAFGAQIGQGEQQLGAGASKAGLFFGEVAADDMTNQWQEEVNKKLYGEPNTPGDQGFFGLQGEDALRAMPQVRGDINKLREQYRGSLTTPAEMLTFDNQTRRLQSFLESQVGRHYDTQFTSYTGATNKAASDLALHGISANAADPNAVTNYTHDLISSRLKEAQNRYGLNLSDDITNDVMANARSDATAQQIRSLARTNPGMALQAMKESGDTLLGPAKDALSRELESVSDGLIAQGAINKARGTAPASAFRAPAGPPIANAEAGEQQLLNEVRHRESSGDYSQIGPKIEQGPHAGETAKGAFQFLDETWKEASAATGRGQQYATADKAPKEDQDANALWLLRNKGVSPWVASGPYPSAGGGAAQASLVADFAKRSGSFGTPEEAGRNLTTVSAPGGAAFQVHAAAAPQISGFLRDLEATGYRIDPTSSGGYNNRNKVGVDINEKSEHAFGTAIDINPDKNKQADTLITDLPPNVGDIAAKWGLKWGGSFEGKKDAMHFEVARLLPNGRPDQAMPGVRLASNTPPGIPGPGVAQVAEAQSALAMNHANTLLQLGQNPDLLSNPKAMQMAEQKINMEYRAHEMVLTGQMKALQEQRNVAADKYVQRMIAGPIDAQILTDIGADPSLDASTRENLWRVYESHTKGSVDGDAAKYGDKFWDTFNRIHAGDDASDKIRDPSQIYQMAGHANAEGRQDLTLAGSKELVRELNERHRDPNSKSLSDVRKGGMDYVKSKLSLEEDYGVYKVRDPKGEEIFKTAGIPAFVDYWDKGLAAGKSPGELVSKGNLDALIEPFKRSAAQEMQDKLEADDEAKPADAPAIVPNDQHKKYLQAHPEFSVWYDQKFGPGAAAAVSGTAKALVPPIATP